jgi:hypothetical protein
VLAFPALALSQTLPDDSWKIDVERAGLISLAECESGMNPRALHPHDGKSASYGLFQWKVGSFYYYNRLYNVFPGLTLKNVRDIIYDPEIQTIMTQKVLAAGGWRNWYNCLKGRYGSRSN